MAGDLALTRMTSRQVPQNTETGAWVGQMREECVSTTVCVPEVRNYGPVEALREAIPQVGTRARQAQTSTGQAQYRHI